MNTENDLPLTVSSAARVAGVSDATIRSWANRGWLRTERTATGLRLFERRDVERVADERRSRRG
jgi:excisionase family DNA binding protein